MDIHPILTSALLVSLVAPEADSQSCDKGWFGENCLFKCHCSGSEICGRHGECPNSEHCTTGYFGPACQYWDLVSTDGSPFNDDYYKDGNDATCNTNRDVTSVTVSMEHWTPFMWIRLVIKHDHADEMNFSLELNNNQQCSNERRFKVNDHTMDITCDNNRALKTVTFNGPVLRYICSILISPGRNVALKQSAMQSPITAGLINSPSNAVDGKTDNVYENSSCSYTTGAQEPWWLLNFSSPKIVLKAVIFNRNVLLTRLDGFKLETFKNDGNLTNVYVHHGTDSLLHYDVAFPCTEPVTSVKITSGSSFLTLCEVQLFGVPVCQEGKYGLSCEHTCSCKVTEICSTVTGICAPGCPVGTFGPNCSSQCPSMCYENRCSPMEGVCFECYPGFTGAHCEKVCEPGTYGHGCILNCSEHCVDVCNNQNGVCKCGNKYRGPNCTDKECPMGMFGISCANSCSEYCLQRECLTLTGECIKCHGFREGRYCEDCPANTFGHECQESCSEYCVNATCHKDTGNCSACTNGYSGLQCSTGPDEILSGYWMFALPIPLLLAVCVGSVFLIGRKRKFSQNDEGEAEI